VARKPKTIDEYLTSISDEKRRALSQLRKTIRKILPKGEECISYGLPAFRVDGKVVAGFAATAKGCSYFPFSGTTLGTLAKDLTAYSQTKSALHFQTGQPLPVGLVRKLLRTRIAEVREKER
jgi:uncharacterized protein YdhG (YjbR/CyaY superfamily)